MINKILLLFISLFFILGASKYNSSITLTVPYTFEHSQTNQWNTIESELKYGNHQIVILLWQGMGGWTDMGETFVKAMQTAQYKGKQVIIRVTGTSWSEHANVLCQAQNVQITSQGELDFHSAWDPSMGRYANDSYEDHYILDPCVQKGYLTKQAEDAIIYKHMSARYKNGRVMIFPDVPRH